MGTCWMRATFLLHHIRIGIVKGCDVNVMRNTGFPQRLGNLGNLENLEIVIEKLGKSHRT